MIKKIMNSLQTAKILGAGQPLRVLAQVGFGEVTDLSIKETQRILRKLKREDKVYYVSCTRVWVLR